jgi:hypothetical protein
MKRSFLPGSGGCARSIASLVSLTVLLYGLFASRIDVEQTE